MEPEDLEFVETNLDSCGKYMLVIGYTVQALCSVYIGLILFYQFYYRECNPASL